MHSCSLIVGDPIRVFSTPPRARGADSDAPSGQLPALQSRGGAEFWKQMERKPKAHAVGAPIIGL